jgi:hypothetical protein
MTQAELKEMLSALREMFDEYLDTLDKENSTEVYGTLSDHADREFKKFLKWMDGDGSKKPKR